MTDMQPKEDEMDQLLRSSLAAPIPSLSPDFDQRLLREVRRSSPSLDRFGKILLTSYGVISAVVSALVMRSHGLDWGTIAGMILAPVLVVAVARMQFSGPLRTTPK